MHTLSAVNAFVRSSIEHGARVFDDFRVARTYPRDLAVLCTVLNSSTNIHAMAGIATRIMDGYRLLDSERKRQFFHLLSERYNVDAAQIAAHAQTYIKERTAKARLDLLQAAEPPRRELFRRLGAVADGTAYLVDMRRDLHVCVREGAVLNSVGSDLSRQIEQIFRRDGVRLHTLTTQSPPAMLTKIVSTLTDEFSDMRDFRRRLAAPDLRHFAFLHPAFGDEPVVFMEVRLCADIPLGKGKAAPTQALAPVETLPVAVFQSVRICKRGLKGLLVGHHLIYDLIATLTQTLPHLKTFVALSPMPEFCHWLRVMESTGDHMAKQASRIVTRPGWENSETECARAKRVLQTLAARYFVQAKTSAQHPLDSRARFHLANGARLSRILWQANASPAAMARSFGMMAAYTYNPETIATYRDGFIKYDQTCVSKRIRDHLVTLH